MSEKTRKAPQDHQRKAVDKLRAEAENVPGFKETEGARVRISGRRGEVVITILDMLDWLGETMALAKEGDYLGAYCGMVSEEDAAALRAVQPTIGSLMAGEVVTEDGTDAGEPSLGESQAS